MSSLQAQVQQQLSVVNQAIVQAGCGAGWVTANKCYNAYLAIQMPEPFPHVTCRQFKNYIVKLRNQKVIDTQVISLGSRGRHLMVRLHVEPEVSSDVIPPPA